ncbi:MAG: hypothetical protein AAGA96_00800 [Verrucomicrobiota bacterium]
MTAPANPFIGPLLVVALACLAACGESKDEPVQPYSQSQGAPPAIAGPVDLQIFIFEDLLPPEITKKYVEPLGDALKDAGVGEIIDTGTSYNDDWRVNYVVLISNVQDVAKGVALLRRKLVEIGAPYNTVIQQNQPYPYVYRVHDG